MTDGSDERNDLETNGGVSRRGFLGSVVPAAVGVAVATEALGAPAKAPAPVPEVPATEPSKLTLTVNGRTHKVLVEPRDTLLVVLREKLAEI